MENELTNELLKQLIELQMVQIELKAFSNKKQVSVIRADNAHTITFIFQPGRDSGEGDIAQRKTVCIPQNSYLFQGSTDNGRGFGMDYLYPTQTLIPSYFPFNWNADTPGDLPNFGLVSQNGNRVNSSRPFSRFMVRNKLMITDISLFLPIGINWNETNPDGFLQSQSALLSPITYSAMRAMVGKQETHSGLLMRQDAPVTINSQNTPFDGCHKYEAKNCNFIFDGSTTLLFNNEYLQSYVQNGGQQKFSFIIQLSVKNIYNS